MPQILLNILLTGMIIASVGFIFRKLTENCAWKVNFKKTWPLAILGITLALAGCTSPSTEFTDTTSNEKTEQQEEEKKEETENKSDSNDETTTTEANEDESAEQADSSKKEQNSNITDGFAAATVISVVDGDTIEIQFEDGTTDKIRLLLVDTPETNHPNLPVQKFGPKATDFAKEQLLDKEVKVEYDGPKRDKYDRLLGYLWVADKTFNEMLLEEGLARYAYVYDPPYTHADALKKAESRAKNAGKNIWSIDGYVTADGFNSPEPEPEHEPKPEPEPESTGYSGPFDPNGPDRDCGDFSTHEEAQAFFEAAGGPDQDPHRLDGSDNDGLACESL